MRQRNTPLKAFAGKSPVKKNYDFSNKRDYSPEATKNTFAGRNISKLIPKNTPAGIFGAVAGGGLIRNLGKAAKVIKSGISSLTS